MPTEVVYLTDEEWTFAVNQAVIRSNAWFCSDPAKRRPGRQCNEMPEDYPGIDALKLRVHRIIEEAPWGQTCTCGHGGGPDGKSTIRIPSDKWKTGCFYHELQHAALHHIRHPCASEIEHSANYQSSSCKRGY